MSDLPDFSSKPVKPWISSIRTSTQRTLQVPCLYVNDILRIGPLERLFVSLWYTKVARG